jgi:hypothetical protein
MLGQRLAFPDVCSQQDPHGLVHETIAQLRPEQGSDTRGHVAENVLKLLFAHKTG